MVSFLCRFSYNGTTGKVSYVPDPILELLQAEITLLPGATGRLGKQSVAIDSINYSSVDFSCSFQLICKWTHGKDTIYFDTHSFFRTLSS